MGKRSPIAQKVEANKRYAARHKFENIAQIVVGEPHRMPNYEQKLLDTEVLKVENGRVVKSEQNEVRRIMYAQRPARKALVRKIIKKWGKLYMAYYDDAELVKLERVVK